MMMSRSSSNQEVEHEFCFFRVYRDGRVEKFSWPPDTVPPTSDPVTGVQCKDVTISTDPQISARIFVPSNPDPAKKLPVLLYIHGGGFSFESAFSSTYDTHVKILTNEANVVAVSVEYRLAPENPIPACYEDCWAALQWLASHANGNGPDQWLNLYADFSRVFVAGDSAGGNISHNLLVRAAGSSGLCELRLVGGILIHPFFSGRDMEEYDEIWLYMCPTSEGLDDPRWKPKAANLGNLGCERLLVLLAENDHLIEGGAAFTMELKRSGWRGKFEIVETPGEEHCFHLSKPRSENAVALVKKIASFINLQE